MLSLNPLLVLSAQCLVISAVIIKHALVLPRRILGASAALQQACNNCSAPARVCPWSACPSGTGTYCAGTG